MRKGSTLKVYQSWVNIKNHALISDYKNQQAKVKL